MAEGFEPYDHHVPQQSRRDKLRVTTNTHQTCLDSNNNNSSNSNLHGFTTLVPLYDPSLISSPDLINVHRQSFNLGVKEEGMNLMGFGSGVSMLSSAATDQHNHHMYVDPQLNPSYVYSTGGVLDHHQSGFHGNNSGQSLSLSLSSHHSNNLPLELNLQRYDRNSMFSGGSKVTGGGGGGGYSLVGGGDGGGGGSSSIELSKSTVPLGPFTGYASVLKGSRFLRPAQQLLEELCDVGRVVYGDKDGVESSLLDPPQLESLTGGNGAVDDPLSCGDGGEQTRKKSKLLSMLDEVYKKYKQYCQQMQGAIASFESVAGLSGAAPFANLALKAMSKHFRCLKNAITDQLQFITKSHGKVHCERDESQRIENSSRAIYGQRPFHSTGFSDQPVWRPQRGLPERAVTVLRAWLFEHFLHPYPTDTDKLMLAKQTGLSRNQVSNWFINARVRLWKPMVEEIHMLETRQGQKCSQKDDQEAPPNRINDLTECENTSMSLQRIGGDFPLKRTREDITETTPRGSEGPMKLPYDHNFLHNNPHLGIGVSNAGGVSLTLGLHQNGVGLPEPSYPINAARRFGLDAHGEAGYAVSGFGGGQNRQFGRDVIDGQLLHDFVG